MQESLFYSEVLKFLKSKVEKRIAEEGLNPKFDARLQSLLNNLSLMTKSLPLDEIVRDYQNFINNKSSIYLEKVLMEAFPIEEFVQTKLWRYYPRMYRGLPRLYERDFPSQASIKKPFTHLGYLKEQAATRALYSLYTKFNLEGRVTLFTWVINDGMGDYSTAIEVFKLLKGRFPKLELNLVALIHQKRFENFFWPQSIHVIAYRDHYRLSLFTKKTFAILGKADLILQIPTFYPYFSALVEKLQKSFSRIPKIESVGEYGFLESNWFHPKTKNYSMGLHFLEKGILIRKPIEAKWGDVENRDLKELRNSQNHFYLAYLATEIGGAVYLHSLLKLLEDDEKDIDLCTPELGWFFRYIERQKQRKSPFLKWDLKVRAIEIYYQGHFHSIELKSSGKTVRFLCPKNISPKDFRILLALSGNWVAVRGDQSFSEAISQNKPFFYDAREHVKYFMKDLVALAENRIGKYYGTLKCIRAMSQVLVCNLPIQEGDWVDEIFFQTAEDWPVIALNIGLALQDSNTFVGFKVLGQILREEHCSNGFLCHLVQRALCHRKWPTIEFLENENMEQFKTGEKSFKELVETQRSILNLFR